MDLEGLTWAGTDYSVDQPEVVVGTIGDTIASAHVAAAGHRVDFGTAIYWAPTATGGVIVDRFDISTSTWQRLAAIDKVDESVLATVGDNGTKVYVFGVGLGLLAIDVGSGEAVSVIEGGADPSLGDGEVGLGELRWSADGTYLAASRCSLELCVTDVVEIAKGNVTRIPDFIGLGVSADGVIGLAGDRHDLEGFTFVDHTTGDLTKVAPTIDAPWDAVSLSDGSVLAYGGDSSSDALSFVIVGTPGSEWGELVIGTYPDHVVVGVSPSSQLALLAPGRRTIDDLVSEGLPLTVMDLQSGAVYEAAVPVDGVD